VNTCVQFALLGLVLTAPLTGHPSAEMLHGMCVVAAASTVASGGAYVHAYLHGRML
jgi:hypothetical protein